jgi:hypothetical protein
MSAAMAAVWLTEEVRVLSLVVLPSITVAALLVLFFEWRGKLQRELVADLDAVDRAG